MASLSRHGKGWKYRHRVPDDLRRVLGKKFWVRTWPGSTSHSVARTEALALEAQYEKLIRGLRRLAPADRDRILVAGGWDNYRQLPEATALALPFVEAVVGFQDDPATLDDREGAVEVLDAIRTATRMRAEAAHAQDVRARLTTHGPGLAALIPTWLKVSDPHNPKTIENMRRYVDRFVKVIGMKAPSDITRQDIIVYRDHVEATYSRTAAKRHFENVGVLLNAGVKDGALPANVAHGIKVRGRPPIDGGKKPFEPAQVRQIFEAMKREHEDFKWVVLLLAYHGMRSGEACQLRPEDITTSLGLPVIRVQADNGRRVKNRESRRDIPLHPACAGIVSYAAQASPGGWLFASFPDWKDGRAARFQKAGNQWLRRIGIMDKALTFHSLRHLWRTLAREVGMPDAVACAIGGWSFGKGEHAKYGTGPSLKVRAEWIARIDPVA